MEEPEEPEEEEEVEPEEPTDEEATEDSDMVDPVWKTWATLQQIRDTPHYSKASYSRTLYQVDRELEFIEKKLEELYMVAVQAGLI